MKLKFIHVVSGLAAVACSAVSCVEINEELGKEYIPMRHQYDVYTDTIYLQDIRLEKTTDLSGYSSSRITIGAVQDNLLGLTTRSSAFTIIPVSRDMDFGTNTRCTQFHFSIIRDTLSVHDNSQAGIIQNVNVYELTEEISEDAGYIDGSDKLATGRRVAPVSGYFGQDSLAFDFYPSFGDEYIEAIKTLQEKEKLDSVSVYMKSLPGVYITVDPPVTEGGRINMFELPLKVSDYYIEGNYAEIKFRADYGHRKDVDSSFLFFFGAQAMQVYEDTESEYVTPQQTAQYALNLSDTEERSLSGSGNLYITGGDGVKPVISAKEIKEKFTEKISGMGIEPGNVIVHKASIILPYEFHAEDYDRMYLYPDRLSPTCRISVENEESEEKTYTFAGLTDSSVESENQGDINRSTCCYAPDVSHHVQEIMRRADDSDFSNYDIWMLTMANETVQEESEDNSALSEYYQNLYYYNYYNSLYNYGYGGYYGGYYGSYYDNYYGMSNYYNYMLAAQYASTQNTSSSAASIQLDLDRYYCGILNGPDAPDTDNLPRMVITYSVSKTSAAE